MFQNKLSRDNFVGKAGPALTSDMKIIKNIPLIIFILSSLYVISKIANKGSFLVI